MRLQTKLLFPLLILTISSLFLLGGLAYFYIVNNTKTLINGEAESLTNTIATLIQENFKSAESNLLLFSKSRQLSQYMLSGEARYDFLQPSLMRQLAEYQKAYPMYYEIRILLPDGEEDTRVINRKINNKSFNDSDSAIYQSLKRGGGDKLQTRIVANPDNNEIAAYLGIPLHFNDPLQPIRDEETDIPKQGFLVITMDIQFIRDLIESIRIGENGFLLVTSASGETIAKPASIQTLPQEVSQAIARQAHEVASMEYHHGDKFYVRQHSLASGLQLFTIIPNSDFDIAARELTRWIIGFTLSIMLFISLLTFHHVRKVVLIPIYNLRDVVNEIGSGNLHPAAKLTSDTDEFSDLYQSVDLMRSNLESSYKNIARMAYFDELTGLPNRTTLRQQLNQMISASSRTEIHFAVVFIDLDNFKNINDTLGHDIGDLLLQETGKRIQKNLRINDYVARQEARDENQRTLLARQGGDEFILLISQFKTPEAVDRSVNRVLRALSQPFEFHQKEVSISASIGIAIYPQDGINAEELLKNADLAMYDAKENGKNSISFYTQEMNVIAFQRHQLERNLKTALDNDEFSLHYQPRISVQGESLDGFEALIRWENLTMGVVSPAQFIPVAEESMLICEIGFWVLDTACAQIKKWVDLGYSDICVSINLSPVQIYRGDTFNMIKTVLSYHGISGQNLEIEITESGLLKDEAIAIAFLENVRSLGVRVALDDFGTGYSSLSYLRKLPIDILKIDRSFVIDVVADADTAIVFESIIGLAKKLKLKTVSEGVETAEQLKFVQQVECDFVQGYYYSRPLPQQEALLFLKHNYQPN